MDAEDDPGPEVVVTPEAALLHSTKHTAPAPFFFLLDLNWTVMSPLLFWTLNFFLRNLFKYLVECWIE